MKCSLDTSAQLQKCFPLTRVIYSSLLLPNKLTTTALTFVYKIGYSPQTTGLTSGSTDSMKTQGNSHPVALDIALAMTNLNALSTNRFRQNPAINA